MGKALQILRNATVIDRENGRLNVSDFKEKGLICINNFNRMGYAPVHIASAAGDVEFLAKLLTIGAIVNCESDNELKNTPLHIAAINGKEAIVEILCGARADTSKRNARGLLPIDLADSNSIRELLLRDRNYSLTTSKSKIVPSVPVQHSTIADPANLINSTSLHDSDSGYHINDPSIESIQAACFATAKSYASNNKYTSLLNELFRYCEKSQSVRTQEANLKALVAHLKADPNLVLVRAVNPHGHNRYMIDGFTLLHSAARFGNQQVIEVLLQEFKCSAWVLDLQGRTALHIAAAHGQGDVCQLLRQKMYEERNLDPVGENAPLDLAGTTPLGWAKFGAEAKSVSDKVKNSLFSPGDKSVLPRTPHRYHNDFHPTDI